MEKEGCHDNSIHLDLSLALGCNGSPDTAEDNSAAGHESSAHEAMGSSLNIILRGTIPDGFNQNTKTGFRTDSKDSVAEYFRPDFQGRQINAWQQEINHCPPNERAARGCKDANQLS